MNRGVWWATVHGVTEWDTAEVTEHAKRLSMYTHMHWIGPENIHAAEISAFPTTN